MAESFPPPGLLHAKKPGSNRVNKCAVQKERHCPFDCFSLERHSPGTSRVVLRVEIHSVIFPRAGSATSGKRRDYEKLPMSMTDDT